MGNVSANTESFICIVDCNGDTISVSPPHAEYSDMTGGTVTQLNTVELGGQNGLYS